MTQRLTDAEYRLELCQDRAQKAEAKVASLEYTVICLLSQSGHDRSTIIAQEAALKIYRQDIDLWDWIDSAAAKEHTIKAELFADWYDKTGLIGVRNGRDILQGAFAKAVVSDE